MNLWEGEITTDGLAEERTSIFKDTYDRKHPKNVPIQINIVWYAADNLKAVRDTVREYGVY